METENNSSQPQHITEPPLDTPPPQDNPSGQAKITKKKLLLAIGIVAAIVLVGAAIFALSNNTKPKSDSQSSNTPSTASETPGFLQQYGDTCKDRDVAFTSPVVPFEQLGFIEPMGKVSDGHVTPTDHIYVAPKNSQAADNTTDVIMPAKGTVVEISAMPAQYVGDRDQQTAPEDHRLVVAFNCRYFAIFIHVHQLSGPLASALGGKLEPNTQKRVSVELNAGDKLGKIGGNPVDMTLVDVEQTLKGFITPDLYKGEPWKVHTIDPLSVYSGETKTKLVAASLRSQEPYGGKIDYDKKGALAGNWFRVGTNGYAGSDQSRYWDGHLSIAPDYIDAKSTVVSIGNWEGKAAQFAAKTAIDPTAITKSNGPTKLELVQLNHMLPSGQGWSGMSTPQKGITVSTNGSVLGTLLVEVQSGEKLKIEKFAGKTAGQVSGFTANAQTYER